MLPKTTSIIDYPPKVDPVTGFKCNKFIWEIEENFLEKLDSHIEKERQPMKSPLSGDDVAECMGSQETKEHISHINPPKREEANDLYTLPLAIDWGLFSELTTHEDFIPFYDFRGKDNSSKTYRCRNLE